MRGQSFRGASANTDVLIFITPGIYSHYSIMPTCNVNHAIHRSSQVVTLLKAPLPDASDSVALTTAAAQRRAALDSLASDPGEGSAIIHLQIWKI